MPYADAEARRAYMSRYQAENRKRIRSRWREWSRTESGQASRRRSYHKTNAKRYGLTAEEYDEILMAQDGRCAVCRSEPGHRRLAIDHDHITGLVRGLLCHLCNSMLGHGRDNPVLLQAGIEYLARHSA